MKTTITSPSRLPMADGDVQKLCDASVDTNNIALVEISRSIATTVLLMSGWVFVVAHSVLPVPVGRPVAMRRKCRDPRRKQNEKRWSLFGSFQEQKQEERTAHHSGVHPSYTFTLQKRPLSSKATIFSSNTHHLTINFNPQPITSIY